MTWLELRNSIVPLLVLTLEISSGIRGFRSCFSASILRVAELVGRLRKSYNAL